MTLASPFNGPVFDGMFADAVETVTKNLLQARPSASAGDIATLQDQVTSVMQNLLNDLAFGGAPSYVFGADNSQLVNRVAGESGVDQTDTETIISEIYTDDAGGLIPHWFGNIAAVVQQAKTAKNTYDALQPNFVQRVTGTILNPVLKAVEAPLASLGVTGTQALQYITIIIVVAVIVALAYAYRSFKTK